MHMLSKTLFLTLVTLVMGAHSANAGHTPLDPWSSDGTGCPDGVTYAGAATYNKMVWENLEWPGDAVQHTNDYLFNPGYAPSFAGKALQCLNGLDPWNNDGVGCVDGLVYPAAATYNKMVWENLMWPGDAVQHTNDYLFHPTYAPSFAGKAAQCLP